MKDCKFVHFLLSLCRHPATINRRRKEEADERENEMDEMRQRGGSLKGVTRVADRENEYQRQHRKYVLSPEVDLLLMIDCRETIRLKKAVKAVPTRRS